MKNEGFEVLKTEKIFFLMFEDFFGEERRILSSENQKNYFFFLMFKDFFSEERRI